MHLLKQELVPALSDNNARIAREEGSLVMELKPHGHGDVHMLLHTSGLAQQWSQEGFRYVTFFQDTNALMWHTFAASLGVSEVLKRSDTTLSPREPS